MRNIVILIISVIMVSCSSNIKTNTFNNKYTALEYNEPVYILRLNEKNPINDLPIGNLAIGTPGVTFDCGYNTATNKARSNARKIGANVVHLTEVKKPSKSSFGNVCYRIKANFYRSFDSKTLSSLDKIILARNKSRLPKNADYAMVYFYKPKYNINSGYKIRKDSKKGEIIGSTENNKKFTYKTKNFGRQVFYGVAAKSDSIEINVKKGQEYFVRSNLIKGLTAFGQHPQFELVENNEIGIKEYNEIKNK